MSIEDIEFPDSEQLTDESFLEELERPPAFQFYASNWISSTSLMDAEQRGWYIQLLAWAWGNSPIQGALPDDEDELRLIAGNRTLSASSMPKHMLENALADVAEEMRILDTEKRWKKVREKFVPSPEHPGFVHNPRLTKVLKRQEMYRDVRKKRAEAGAKAKWQRWKEENPDKVKTANNPPSTTSTSKQTPSKARVERKHNQAHAKPLLESASLSLPLNKDFSFVSFSVDNSTSKKKHLPTLFDESKFQVTNEMRDNLRKNHPELKEEDYEELRKTFCHSRYGQSQLSWKRQFYTYVHNQITKYGYTPITQRPLNSTAILQNGAQRNGRYESAAERNDRFERDNDERLQQLRSGGSGDSTENRKALPLPANDTSSKGQNRK